jgi:hypothetical protein
METPLLIVGGLVIAGFLAGFFRSFWQSPPKPADAVDSLAGMPAAGADASYRTDSGDHGGAHGGTH